MRIFVKDRASGLEGLHPEGHAKKITTPLKYRDKPAYSWYSEDLSASGGLFFEHNPREIGSAPVKY